MNRFQNFLILFIILFLVEFILVFIQILLFDSSKMDIYNIRRAWLGSGQWNLWRVLFFGLPFIIFYLFLFKYFRNIKLNKPLLISLFNISVYVSLSVLSRVIWGENIPLPPNGIMFWITCIAIFSSPLILAKVPYFKKLMDGL
jgi:hypothetical protein